MALNDRREPKMTGGEPPVVTHGEIEKIGNALPLTVAANINVQAADRNDNCGINTSNQENLSDQILERENATSQHLNPKNIFIGPKKTGKIKIINHDVQTLKKTTKTRN